jgi:hypothetical protein
MLRIIGLVFPVLSKKDALPHQIDNAGSDNRPERAEYKDGPGGENRDYRQSIQAVSHPYHVTHDKDEKATGAYDCRDSRFT